MDKRHSQKSPPGEMLEGIRPPTRVLLLLTSGDRKVKELNLMTEDCLCVMQKLGGGDKSIKQ